MLVHPISTLAPHLTVSGHVASSLLDCGECLPFEEAVAFMETEGREEYDGRDTVYPAEEDGEDPDRRTSGPPRKGEACELCIGETDGLGVHSGSTRTHNETVAPTAGDRTTPRTKEKGRTSGAHGESCPDGDGGSLPQVFLIGCVSKTLEQQDL